jgi:hypothetical protein
MPDDILAEVSACLWDLRAQCEHQLRALSEAQRAIEAYRDASSQPTTIGERKKLLEYLSRVIEASAQIRQLAEDSRAEAARLPHTAISFGRRHDDVGGA